MHESDCDGLTCRQRCSFSITDLMNVVQIGNCTPINSVGLHIKIGEVWSRHVSLNGYAINLRDTINSVLSYLDYDHSHQTSNLD